MKLLLLFTVAILFSSALGRSALNEAVDDSNSVEAAPDEGVLSKICYFKCRDRKWDRRHCTAWCGWEAKWGKYH